MTAIDSPSGLTEVFGEGDGDDVFEAVGFEGDHPLFDELVGWVGGRWKCTGRGKGQGRYD